MLSILTEFLGIGEMIKAGEPYQIPDDQFEKEKEKAYENKDKPLNTTSEKILTTPPQSDKISFLRPASIVSPSENNLIDKILKKIN